jgi:hypothetical protein
MLWLLAAALPALYWQGGPETAPQLRQVGIRQIFVPESRAESWKSVSGIQIQTADLRGAIKLPAPGIDFRMNRSSATRAPWINSNGWQFMRRPAGRFYYDVNGAGAALAAAEAFCYDAGALIQTDSAGLEPLSRMLKFLDSIKSSLGVPVADIGFVDDGSPAAGEVMNLFVRDNLLFRTVHSEEPGVKLTVQFGSPAYPASEAKNPHALVHRIRANLTDGRRTLRIYGASVVVARLTQEPGRLRLQLLNYGAARGTRIGAFRVRVLGRYSRGQLHSYESAGDQLVDYDLAPDATEFTVPGLKAYAAVDLFK